MKIHPELDEYSIPAKLDRYVVENEAENLRSSLPYYFYSVKYHWLLFFMFVSKKSNRKEQGVTVPLCGYSEGKFKVTVDGNTFYYDYSEKKCYFASVKYASDILVEVTDRAYVNALKRSFRRIYGLKFILPYIFL